MLAFAQDRLTQIHRALKIVSSATSNYFSQIPACHSRSGEKKPAPLKIGVKRGVHTDSLFFNRIFTHRHTFAAAAIYSRTRNHSADFAI